MIYFLKTQNNILKLVFSDGSNPALNIQEKATILQVQGLDMPKAGDDPSGYSTGEKNGITLMLLIGKSYRNLVHVDKYKQLYLLMRVGHLVLRDKVKSS